jgi:hypothetical protein
MVPVLALQAAMETLRRRDRQPARPSPPKPSAIVPLEGLRKAGLPEE